ncbi:MAG: TetR/AcrR family transcriptional regulator [bacterium]|nr:MAG: TetR/AcrR family transcriptional regulator [bacterium]
MTRDESTGISMNTAGEKRRKAILDAAWSLFLEKGYAAVSVDEIIRASGGSKSSLYKYFGSKEGILKELIESFAEDMLTEVKLPFPLDKTPEATLKRIGLRIGGMALSPFAINQYRLAVSNANPFPEIARMWYEFGPKKTFDGLAEYMEKVAEAGKLTIKNPERAALFFFGMIIFKDNMAMSIGAPPPTEAELEEIVDEAVRVFLAAYGREEV